MRSITKEIKERVLQEARAATPFIRETRPGLPKVVANSFPKSGTHLLSKLVGELGFIELPILMLPEGYCDFSKPGTWGDWQPIRDQKVNAYGNPSYISCPATRVLPRFRAGQFAPAHLGRRASTEKLLRSGKFKHLMIVRDLRDCVFSYVQHHLSLTTSFHRPDWYYYLSALNNIEDQLIAIIEGRDRFLESYRSQIENTSKWLNDPGVLVVCYEHLIGDNGGGSAERQKKEVQRIAAFLGLKNDDLLVEKAAESLWGGGSRTFRSGKMNYWKEAFSPRVQEVFDRELGDLQKKVQDLINQPLV